MLSKPVRPKSKAKPIEIDPSIVFSSLTVLHNGEVAVHVDFNETKVVEELYKKYQYEFK